jgi:nitroreductase
MAVCPVEAVTHPALDLAGFLPAPKSFPFSPEALYLSLRARRSCRAYQDKGVPRELLEKLIDIARYAPTGHNRQNFEFIVVQDRNRIQKLVNQTVRFFHKFAEDLEASPEPHPLKRLLWEFHKDYEFALQGRDRIFRGAPVVILLHAPTGILSSIDNCLYAMLHMVMMAEALGLATCINRRFLIATDRVPEIPKELGVPAGNQIFGCVTVGFPKHKFHRLPSRNPAKVKWL